MNSVSVDGVLYTKASILAKKLGYTTDYIGQLCRAEKVSAQLIGRSWYVHEDALLVHKDSRYQSLRQNEITSNYNVKIRQPQTEKVMVLPVLSKTTKRSVFAQHNQPRFFSHLLTDSTVKYESDDIELLPQPKVKEIIKPLPVLLADSEKIKVKVLEKSTTPLEFTELPSVTLQGILPIMPFESVSESMATPITLPKVDVVKKPVSVLPPTTKSSNPFIPVNITHARVASSGGIKVIVGSLLLGCIISLTLISFDSYIFFDGSIHSQKLIFNAASLGHFFGFSFN